MGVLVYYIKHISREVNLLNMDVDLTEASLCSVLVCFKVALSTYSKIVNQHFMSSLYTLSIYPRQHTIAFDWGCFLFASTQIQVFEPFSILGLEPGASDSEIKKAYRRLSIQYHPDKNPDPGRMSSIIPHHLLLLLLLLLLFFHQLG